MSVEVYLVFLYTGIVFFLCYLHLHIQAFLFGGAILLLLVYMVLCIIFIGYLIGLFVFELSEEMCLYIFIICFIYMDR